MQKLCKCSSFACKACCQFEQAIRWDHNWSPFVLQLEMPFSLPLSLTLSFASHHPHGKHIPLRSFEIFGPLSRCSVGNVILAIVLLLDLTFLWSLVSTTRIFHLNFFFCSYVLSSFFKLDCHDNKQEKDIWII